MTEEQLNKQTEQLELRVSTDKPSENKRRRLIKGAAAAIPVIMTLHSGAALAATSNLVGPVHQVGDAVTSPRTFTDSSGNVVRGDIICVQKGMNHQTLENGTVDLGEGAMAGTNPIKMKDEFGQDLTDPDLEAQVLECIGDGNGIMVSTLAWDSLGPKLGSGL